MIALQNIHSNCCSICSVINLLGLYDVNIDCDDACRIFGIPSHNNTNKITHKDITLALYNAGISKDLYWKCVTKKPLRYIYRLFSHHDPTRMQPMLATFNIQHKQKSWGGIHCVVITSTHRNIIHIIDSLGKQSSGVYNAKIIVSNDGSHHITHNIPWVLDGDKIHILVGLPSIPVM